MMKNTMLIGLIIALGTGILIGTQATMSTRGGQIIGPIRTGVITNLGSGIFALIFLLVTIIWRTMEWRNLPNPTVGALILSGGLGVLIIMGASFSLRYIGVTAGAATLILGQLLISTIVDATGLSGTAPIPVDARRIFGLVVMTAAIFLLTPRR